MKKIYHRFFNISECEKISDKVFKKRIIFSAFVMVICCMAFCSATFAWFTSTKKVDISPITAASYSMDIYIGETKIGTSSYDQKLNKIQSVSYTCPLATGDKHTFILKFAGTGKKGYCGIKVGDGPEKILQTNENKEEYTIEIIARKDTKITFSANWGEYSGERTSYGRGSYIEISTTPYETYTVAEGATWNQIAEHYKVSVADIQLYNGITELTVGQEIKIPNTSVTTPLVIKQAEGNEGSTTQPSEGNGSPTTEGDTPPVNTEAPATSTEETANPETPSTPSESEASGDDTTTSTSTETTGQESEGDVETQAQQNSETESIAVTE